jgi:HTH-type transcriptional regulator / antitoxin HigA
MDIHPICTESDYKAALKKVSVLMESDPEPGTPQGDHLNILVTLVQAYEARHVPIGAPDATAAD